MVWTCVFVLLEAEDGVQTDTGEGLECGGDAGLLEPDIFGTARLHRNQGRTPQWLENL